MRNFRIGKQYPVCQICWKPLRDKVSPYLGVGPICLRRALFEEGVEITEEEREVLLKYAPSIVDKLDQLEKSHEG